MTVTLKRHWKCERCDTTAESSPTLQPSMWGAIKWITGGVPEAANDHPHWTRWHLCSPCIDSLIAWLGGDQ